MGEAGDRRGEEERRSSERIAVEMWVEESTERALYFQRGANISAGGIFLERTIPHVKGTVVNLRFTLPGDTVPIDVKGEIVNVKGETVDEGKAATNLGMGIKFVELADKYSTRIQAFIQRASSS